MNFNNNDYTFNNNLTYIFMFCHSCWFYTKFILTEPINWNKTDDYACGSCVKCDFEDRISILQIKKYYQNMNKYNS